MLLAGDQPVVGWSHDQHTAPTAGLLLRPVTDGRPSVDRVARSGDRATTGGTHMTWCALVFSMLFAADQPVVGWSPDQHTAPTAGLLLRPVTDRRPSVGRVSCTTRRSNPHSLAISHRSPLVFTIHDFNQTGSSRSPLANSPRSPARTPLYSLLSIPSSLFPLLSIQTPSPPARYNSY